MLKSVAKAIETVKNFKRNNKVENFELEARFDARQSFYGKARVEQLQDGTKLLYSYDTLVAMVDKNGVFYDNGTYSNTTLRHQKEFAKQFAEKMYNNDPKHFVNHMDDSMTINDIRHAKIDF